MAKIVDFASLGFKLSSEGTAFVVFLLERVFEVTDVV